MACVCITGDAMTTYTHEQHALAAMLVPEHVKFDAQCQTWFAATVYGRSDDDSEITAYRQWQPTADTEAGRSDALVLLAAVCEWLERPDEYSGIRLRCKWEIATALNTGNVQKIQHATFAAAVAIGEYMKGE